MQTNTPQFYAAKMDNISSELEIFFVNILCQTPKRGVGPLAESTPGQLHSLSFQVNGILLHPIPHRVAYIRRRRQILWTAGHTTHDNAVIPLLLTGILFRIFGASGTLRGTARKLLFENFRPAPIGVLMTAAETECHAKTNQAN
jgi:hypothetical protein